MAILRFNVRMEKRDDQDWLAQEFARIEQEVGAQDGITITRYGKFTRPPKVLSEKNTKLFELMADCGEKLGQEIAWKATGGCCDGNNLAAYGVPNIDTLGVRGGDIHSDREFVLLDSLSERASLSALFLLRLAAGEITL